MMDMVVEDFIEDVQSFSDDELKTVAGVIENEQLRRHELVKMRESVGKKK